MRTPPPAEVVELRKERRVAMEKAVRRRLTIRRLERELVSLETTVSRSERRLGALGYPVQYR